MADAPSFSPSNPQRQTMTGYGPTPERHRRTEHGYRGPIRLGLARRLYSEWERRFERWERELKGRDGDDYR